MRKQLLNTINEIENKISKNKVPPKFKKIANFLIGIIEIINLIIAIAYRTIILLLISSIITTVFSFCFL